MHKLWRAKRHEVYSGKQLFQHYYFQLSLACKTVSKISLKLFCSGDERLLPEFLRKWVWFQRHSERFPIYPGYRTEERFCRWKSTDNNINIIHSLENPCTFFLKKEKTWKRIFNTNSEFSQNHTEKQIMPSKTKINWLFNFIWCLFTACFDWKVGFFQQAIVRVYYILH